MATKKYKQPWEKTEEILLSNTENDEPTLTQGEFDNFMSDGKTLSPAQVDNILHPGRVAPLSDEYVVGLGGKPMPKSDTTTAVQNGQNGQGGQNGQNGGTTKKPSAYDTLDTIYSDRFGLTKQEQKRRRRDEMISSIGDAVTALGSMYFATKDGVPVYDPTKSMTEATRKRYDRLLNERRQAYNDYLTAERLRELNDYRKRRLDLDAQKLAEAARVNDSKIEANKALYLQRKAAGAAQEELAEIRRYQALLEKYKAEGYPEYLKAQIADYESRVRRNDASAGASAASANLSNTRAANVNAEKTTVTTEGEDGSKISTTTYTQKGSNQSGNNGGGKTPLPKAEPAQTQQTTPKKKKLPGK